MYEQGGLALHLVMIPDEAIKHASDFQIAWHEFIKPLVPGNFHIEPPGMLSIHGDAPKSFVRIQEHADGRSSGKNSRRRRISRSRNRWPAYIAKVGSKSYPVESITEHLLTRIGQCYGFRVADSQLRIVGTQVRFLSRFFLKKNESLFHGIDLFRMYLDDDELVEGIAQAREEQRFYTFQTVLMAVEDRFPAQIDSIMRGVVEMLTFDALVGNNDRHPANWGVITPTDISKPPRFSPVFDTARALFWNASEKYVRDILSDESRLIGYINRSRPLIGWDNYNPIAHFELIQRIFDGHVEYRPHISRFVKKDISHSASDVIEREFGRLLSNDRRELILRCVRRRRELLCVRLGFNL